MDLKQKNFIKELTKLVCENKLDFIKVGDIEIKKSIHFKASDIKNEQKALPESEEEMLYWSSTPNLRVNL